MKADSLHLQLLKLAKEGNGLIAPSAFISFSCRPVEPLRPVAFTSEESHVVTIFDIVYKKSGFSLSQKHFNLKYNLVPKVAPYVFVDKIVESFSAQASSAERIKFRILSHLW